MKEDFRFKKYGKPTKSNIKWTYNFDPLKKWTTILLGALTLAGSMWMIRQDVLQRETAKSARIEAEQERRKYLERRLESIKQETIAAAMKKEEPQAAAPERKTVKRRYTGSQRIYTWKNERGQTVYSTRPRER